MSTSVGNIQFGIPPETVKDSMSLGVSVPEYYIVPREKFDWNDGISLMEFEFPVYYNYFLRHRTPTKFICDEKTAAQIRVIFQETLLGPTDFADFADDFAEDYRAAPDIARELAYFARSPQNPAEVLRLDDFLEFLVFDAEGKVRVRRPGVEVEVLVELRGGSFLIFEQGKFLCEFEDAVMLNKHEYFAFKTMEDGAATPFVPPLFGVTVLGSSHGFDCAGSTSGFILWLNGKGVMIDPPPYSSKALREAGVPACLIEKLIISHCHADHDAGAFHKLTDAAPIDFVSTPTIMRSFLRKYSAAAQVPVAELERLFNFRRVRIGHPTVICGARFVFEYAFHSIPTLCFSVELDGKRFFFSGDTFYHPERLAELQREGVLSPERHRALAERDFAQYDAIFHEAGIPPIHSPAAVFAAWPPALKEKLFLYHIAAKDVPAESGLRTVESGLTRTLVLCPRREPASPLLSNLELFCSLEIARDVPLSRVFDVVQCFRERRFAAGEAVLKAGTRSEGFFVVKSGACRVWSAEGASPFSKLYYAGDYFGESALLGDGLRMANVTALSDAVVLEIHKHDLLWAFASAPQRPGRPSPLEMMRNLGDIRRAKLGEFVNANDCIAQMTERQKSLLNMCLREAEVRAGEWLWQRGGQADFCFFIKSGKYQMKLPALKLSRRLKLVPGTLVGDFPNLCDARTATRSEVVCLQDGSVLKITREDFAHFIREYPSFYVLCKDRFAIY